MIVPLYSVAFYAGSKFRFYCVLLSAREKVVGWYHTGPKLNQNDVAINELMRRYCPNSVSYQLRSE